ncbi:MAG: HAMP domain-containing sensor histidine kinase [Planctomycetota bacterium]
MSSPHHTAVTPDQLAHELNNLLDGSIRNVGMAARRLPTLGAEAQAIADLEERLRAAERSMHQMADVIERYARDASETSSDAPADAPTRSGVFGGRGSLRDAVVHAGHVYGPTLGERGVELTVGIDPAVATLPAGPVYTVLANAVSNAMQAIERHAADTPPCITLMVVGDRGDVVVEVCDTGPGLDPAVLDGRGGVRFGVTTRPGGHGIGLGVCRQIADELGGRLTLTNSPSGVGATLTFRYPASLGSSQRTPVITEANLPGAGSKLPGGRRAG